MNHTGLTTTCMYQLSAAEWPELFDLDLRRNSELSRLSSSWTCVGAICNDEQTEYETVQIDWSLVYLDTATRPQLECLDISGGRFEVCILWCWLHSRN